MCDVYRRERGLCVTLLTWAYFCVTLCHSDEYKCGIGINSKGSMCDGVQSDGYEIGVGINDRDSPVCVTSASVGFYV